MKWMPRYQRRFEMDPEQYPVVVFESDDWGACETVPPCSQKEYRQLLQKYTGNTVASGGSLETPEELEAIFNTLQNFRGRDHFPAVFTAFTCMANPDFAAIAASNYQKYQDIAINDGFPSGWGGTGVISKTLEGRHRAVWEPEYHSMLHHTSPKLWLELLSGSGKEAELARELFQLQCYYQLKHIPEYEGYNIREQFEFINTGFARFEKLFGHTPAAAVTSDAYPETELLWAARGVRTVCIKNCRVNSGEVVVYPNKPWNMQDVYARIGDYEPFSDVVYLTRNVFMEQQHDAAEVLQSIDNNFCRYREPVVISTHRSNYCSSNPKQLTKGLKRLATVLAALEKRQVIFLTSGELGDLYRQGWSSRLYGEQLLYRRWFAEAEIPDFATGLPVGNHLLPLNEDRTKTII